MKLSSRTSSTASRTVSSLSLPRRFRQVNTPFARQQVREHATGISAASSPSNARASAAVTGARAELFDVRGGLPVLGPDHGDVRFCSGADAGRRQHQMRQPAAQESLSR